MAKRREMTLREVLPWAGCGFYLFLLWFWGTLSWGKWCDPLVDFGQQLYLAWQVSEGKHLYRDLAYYNGPVSVWINSAVFQIGSVNLWHLIAFNGVVLVAILGLVHWLIAKTSNQLTAFVCGALFLCLFAFGNYLSVANYNYLAPYNHEMTHGMLFALGMIVLLCSERLKWWLRSILAGLCLGCVWLTKAELSLAATGAAVVWWVGIALRSSQEQKSLVVKSIVVFFVAGMIPVVTACLVISRDLPMSEAFAATMGSWRVAFRNEIRNLPFYRSGMGIDQPVENGLRILLCGAGFMTLVVISAGLGSFARGFSATLQKAMLATFLIVQVPVAMFYRESLLTCFFLPLPLVLIVLWGNLAREWSFQSEERERGRTLQRLVLVTFAGMLLGKMALATRVSQYGFVLAMPATMVVAAAFLYWIPQKWKFSRSAVFLQSGTMVILTALLIAGYEWQERIYLQPTTSLGSRSERITPTSGGAAAAAGVVDYLSKAVPGDETVLVFPEGVMLNYLTRRSSGVAYTNFMPPEVFLFGEKKIVDSLVSAPPDWIVLFAKDLKEYGVKLGRGYLDEVLVWMQADYQPATTIQDPQGFKILVMKRQKK